MLAGRGSKAAAAGRHGSYRSAHHDLGSLLQSFGLLPHAASSVHSHRPQRVGFSKALALRVDLASISRALAALFMLNDVFSSSYLLTKLSGGTHNDGDGPLSCLQLLLIHDVDQHRPNKGCGFTAAGLGYSNHVTPRQSDGNALRHASTRGQIAK